MDLDGLNPTANRVTNDLLQIDQTIQMEEDFESIDLSELDLIRLEEACQQKEFDKISPRQIETLEVALAKVQQHKKLGIQPGSRWDSLKVMKETKKRGRKPD